MAMAAASFNKIERAHQMYRDGKHEDALEFYTEALAMAKTKVQKIALHSNRAACFLKLHDFKKAAEECTSVLELDYKHTGALMLRAQTLVTLKEYQSALFDVNRLMELNPSSEVYQNLQSQLKTQLSLAPIPESEEEEEALAAELEEEEEEEALELQLEQEEEHREEEEESQDHPSVVSEVEEPLEHHPVVPEVEEPLEHPPVVPEVEEPLEHPPVVPELELVKKTVFPNLKPEVPRVKDLSKLNPNGWNTIPKPKGHSRLDYSRWDEVEDDSSEDENDEEEDSQPQYRFRVRTVGVRPVK
ncbi:uncharacterized protein [Aristolochia californica]|uniref:uncharacterized protein n=1 Tax=Aristolochia californica TaxID=171875 RepID=UPI0035D5A7E9